MKLVKVYQAKDEIDAALIVGFLENEGIKAFDNEASVNMPPFLSGEYRSMMTHMIPRDIFVDESQAEEAKTLINEVR